MSNNIILISGNELRRLFKSPLAWINFSVVQFLVAIFFYMPLMTYLQPGSVASGLTNNVVSTMYGFAAYIILIISPLLTMRLFAEERQLGTIKLLFSSPISITELVLGKFFGIVIFYILIIAMITLMPASLLFGATLDLGQILSSIIGLCLLATTLVAIGLFFSSLTTSPVIAAVNTYGILFLLLLIKIAASNSSERTAEIFTYLSLDKHYDNFLNGIFNTIDLFYYITLSLFFICLCIWRLDIERVYK